LIRDGSSTTIAVGKPDKREPIYTIFIPPPGEPLASEALPVSAIMFPMKKRISVRVGLMSIAKVNRRLEVFIRE
jgi:hypothetical protein